MSDTQDTERYDPQTAVAVLTSIRELMAAGVIDTEAALVGVMAVLEVMARADAGSIPTVPPALAPAAAQRYAAHTPGRVDARTVADNALELSRRLYPIRTQEITRLVYQLATVVADLTEHHG